MDLTIKLNNINIPATYNIYYMFGDVGSNLNFLDTINSIPIVGDFNGSTQTILLTSVAPFDKEIFILLKEKNGNRYISKNFYVNGEEFFGCTNCCTFDGGSTTFTGWNIDCNFGVGVIGEIICQFTGGSTTFTGYSVDCNFGVDVIGEIICKFEGGSTTFNGYNVNCDFDVYVDDSNVRPEVKISRDFAGTDLTDLISSSNNIELYCQYITTYNGTSISSAIWQFKPISIGGSWIDSTNVTVMSLQNYPTNMDDFLFRVKVVDSNGLVGYSNVIAKYYIDEPPQKYQAYLNRNSDTDLEICNQFNGEVLLNHYPPQIGDVVYDINNYPLIGYYYVRISNLSGFDKTFILDSSNGKIIDNYICQ